MQIALRTAYSKTSAKPPLGQLVDFADVGPYLLVWMWRKHAPEV
jgi:hypothetical protein